MHDDVCVTRMWASPGVDGGNSQLDEHEEWQRVDAALRAAVQRLREQTGLEIVFLLTDGDVERTAEAQYIYLEPLANVVIGISSTGGGISITSDDWLWDADSLRPVFEQLTEYGNQRLREQELPEALIDIARRAPSLMLEPPRRASSDSGPDWVDRALDKAIDHYSQPSLGAKVMDKVVPTSLRYILMTLALVLGGIFSVLFAVVVVDSWMTPEADRPFEWGAMGHVLLLLAAVISIALCGRMAWRFFNDWRGRPLSPLRFVSNERIGWVLSVVFGVPFAVYLVLTIVETEWRTDIPLAVQLPMHVLGWIEQLMFTLLWLAAPLIGRQLDQRGSE